MAQISPVWLNKQATLDKVEEYISKAGSEGCELVIFGEELLPSFPFIKD
ncbi:nitrilase-related carbon-nitrogen hydrolase [Pontibacter harenae]